LGWYAIQALYDRVRNPAIILRVPLSAYVASMLLVMGFTIAKLHRDGGTTEIDYGTALKPQMEAIARIHHFSPRSPIEIQYYQWIDFPYAKDVLLALLPAPTEPLPTRRLIVRNRDAFPGDAHITVEDLPVSSE